LKTLSNRKSPINYIPGVYENLIIVNPPYLANKLAALWKLISRLHAAFAGAAAGRNVPIDTKASFIPIKISITIAIINS